MEVKTYRAASMQEALVMVRSDLGPDAAVLHTREVRGGRFFGLLPGKRRIEVTASCDVNVPSRLPRREDARPADRSRGGNREYYSPPRPPLAAPPMQSEQPEQFQDQLSDLRRMVSDLCKKSRQGGQHDLPDALFHVFTDLIEADVDECIARRLVEQVQAQIPDSEMADSMLVKARVSRLIESQIKVSGPIAVTPGRRRLVALVGPTGVGKTTTIAKLAANHRLKKRQSVGLITVDTYRIAAVEQLRTYADIIDLPMQVVSTPREMREAVHRLAGLDLVLMDTAGRSPRDEIKIQELKAFLSEAGADEVHLVLSSGAGSRTLQQTARQFAAVGATSLILTKLDESAALGNLLALVQSSDLPLSYLTNGQNVPDDIETADAARLAQLIMSGEAAML